MTSRHLAVALCVLGASAMPASAEFCRERRLAFAADETVALARGYIACLEFQLAIGLPLEPSRADGDQGGRSPGTGPGLPVIGPPRPGNPQAREIVELFRSILALQAQGGLSDDALEELLGETARGFGGNDLELRFETWRPSGPGGRIETPLPDIDWNRLRDRDTLTAPGLGR